MSFWTHIVATLDVETYIYDKDVKTRVEELLRMHLRLQVVKALLMSL